MDKKYHHKYHHNKYRFLLYTLISLFLTTSIFEQIKIIAIINSVILGLVLFSIIKLFLMNRNKFYTICLLCSLLSVLANIITVFLGDEYLYVQIFLRFFASLVSFGILSLAFYLINKNLIEEKEVNADTIRGSISSFLLVGYLWYLIYRGIAFFDSQAFSREDISNFDLFYFSFTTLTTTGYGDIFPVNNIAKTFANLQSIIGVMYPSIIIARLVGLYSNQEHK
jgi:hypothetical protein